MTSIAPPRSVDSGTGTDAGRRAVRRLLLATARPELGASRRRAVRKTLGARRFDVRVLLDRAERHATAPLLVRHLRAHADAELGPGLREELERRADGYRRRAVRMTLGLHRAVDALGRRGLPALLLKGPALAERLYGDVSARLYEDLDLLVPRDRLPEAAAVLEEAGWRPTSPPPVGTPARPGRTLVSPGGVECELHGAAFDRYHALPLAFADLRPDAAPARRYGGGARGNEALRPGRADELLYLLAHGGKHRWVRLGWVADVAAYLDTQPVDAGRLRERAQRRGALRLVRAGLGVANRLLDAPVPPQIGVAADPRAGALADRVAGDLRRRLAGEAGPEPSGPRRLLFWLRARERGRDRARVAGRLLVCPNRADHGAVALPDGLGALYRLVRPLRLLWKYGVRPAVRRIAAPLRRLAGGVRPGPRPRVPTGASTGETA